MTTSESTNTTERVLYVPKVVAIDFDRTLSDPRVAMQRFFVAAEACGVPPQALSGDSNIENDASSYNPISVLRQALTTTEGEGKMAVQHFDQKVFDGFLATFTSDDLLRQRWQDRYAQRTLPALPPLLYPDSQPFLDRLARRRVPYIVPTYGQPEWQLSKLQASGLKGQFMVLDHADKGAYIAQRRGADGRFYFPYCDEDGPVTLAAKTVHLIDDKVAAFASLPGDCSGFLIRRDSELLPSQRGELTADLRARVKVIQQLGEIIVAHDGELRVLRGTTAAPIED